MSQRLDENAVLLEVRAAVAHALQVPSEAVADDSVLLDLGADSLAFLDLLLRVERAFNIALPHHYAMPHPHTVRDYVSAILDAAEAREGG